MKRFIPAALISLALILVSCVSSTVAPGGSARPADNPATVSPQLLAQLQEALAAQLEAQGGKGVADVTGVLIDGVTWNYSQDTANISWLYNNTGDYDKNSEVNAADLVPIALNYGVTDQAEQWPLAEVADGDANGEVNISDVTPIGVNFGSRVTNYVVEGDIDGSGNWHPVLNVPFDAGAETGGSSLLRFSANLNLGDRCHGFRVYAEQPAELYDLSDLPPINNPPVAVLEADPAEGGAPLEVTWDAAGSTDYDGSIVRFDWDLDNDGSYEVEQGAPFQHVTYPDPGIYTVGVLVIDNLNLQDSTTAQVVVGEHVNEPPVAELVPDPAFGPLPLDVTWDASGSVDNDGSIVSYDWDMDHDGSYEVIDGGPSMELNYDTSADHYVSVRVTDDSGAQDSATTYAEVSGPVPPEINPFNWHGYIMTPVGGSKHAAVLLNGKPYIAYLDGSPRNIMLAYSSVAKPTGPEDWTTVLVDDGSALGLRIDMVVCQGVPCITYMDTTNKRVYFASANSATPDSPNDWYIHVPDSEGNGEPQLAVAQGQDMVRLVMTTRGGILYLQPKTPTLPRFSFDWDRVVLTEGDDPGVLGYYYLDMEPVGSGVGLACRRLGQPTWRWIENYSDLIYAFVDGSDALDPANWTFTVVDDSEQFSGFWPRLTVDGGGHPVLAWSNSDEYKYLNYGYTSETYPLPGDWTRVKAFSRELSDVGKWLGLGLFDGKPLMAFWEEGPGAATGLRVAYGSSGAPTGPSDFFETRFDQSPGGQYDWDTNVLILEDGTPVLIYRCADGLKFEYYDP